MPSMWSRVEQYRTCTVMLSITCFNNVSGDKSLCKKKTKKGQYTGMYKSVSNNLNALNLDYTLVDIDWFQGSTFNMR